MTDLAGADDNRVKTLGGRVDEGRECLFHTDRRTAAVDVARQRQQLLLRNHRDRLYSRRARSRLEVERLADGHDEDEVVPLSALCDERLEHPLRRDADQSCDSLAVGHGVVVLVRNIVDMRGVEQAHYVGLVHHLTFLSIA